MAKYKYARLPLDDNGDFDTPDGWELHSVFHATMTRIYVVLAQKPSR